MASDYKILNLLVDRLSEIGFTMLQVYDDVMGRLWDSTALLQRGKNSATIRPLIQIIAERGTLGSSDGTANYA
jgi:hypothetical protein